MLCDSRSSALPMSVMSEVPTDGVEQVDHLGRDLEAAERRALAAAAGRGELLLHHVVELGQRRGLHAVERGDAHDQVRAQRSGRKHASTSADLVGIEVRQHDGDDLRMLVAHQLGDRARVHPLERFEALALAAEADAIHEARGLVVAERIHQHLAHEFVAAHAERGLLLEPRW